MTRQRLNVVIRLVLLGSTLLSLGFLIASARPASPYLQPYPAVVGQPQPITGYWDIPAIWVTVSQPAVVTFPVELEGSDKVCMVVRFERGEAPAISNSIESEPQNEWDNNPPSALLIFPQHIVGDAGGTASLRFATPVIAGKTAERFPYRVNWIGRDVIALYDKQWTGGLLCYDFVSKGTADPMIPLAHSVSFKAENVHIARSPTFFFHYGITANPNGIRTSFELHKQEFGAYLAQVAAKAPFAVTPLHLT